MFFTNTNKNFSTMRNIRKKFKEDRKTLSEEATDLWVAGTIQAHYLFVMDLLDDSIVPNSIKDIANLAQFIYACIGEGQTKGQIPDIARSITKKSNNEKSDDVDFSGGYTESEPEFILMDKNHRNRCFHFESDKTSDSSNFKLLSEEEDRSLANLKDMRNTSTKVYIYTDPDTKVQYLIISDTIKNKLGDYIDHKIAITPRYIVNRDGAYSIMREED